MLDVLRAHFLIVDHFYSEGRGIGGVGPRDPNLLHSAVYRQFVSFDGNDKWKDPFERCATLVYGLVKDHPFHDANKRTGLLVLLYFLARINRSPTIKQRPLENFVVDIAENNLKKRRVKKSSGRRSNDPEIIWIADFIRKNSRKRDNRYYTITYQELDQRLRDYGFCLDNPHKNFIDVCKIKSKRKFGFGPKDTSLQKIAQIGFPGWKRQVGKGAISTVRREAKLTTEHGVDSESFFHGADPIYSLIDQYHAPLKRLAFR
ncbi:MAG: type II toxin-antitoxin system death-on-curing family toxin [Gammaproteobacteria bacterium]|nr:type II toxin-antitoxin system death-on-curing family toxin [Gammaproteobacteria bacterium]